MMLPPLAHQGFGGPGESDQGVATDVERGDEAAARRVDGAPQEVLAVGVGDGVDQEVQASPALAQPGEDGVDLVVVRDVERFDDRGAHALGEGPHPAVRGRRPGT